MQSRFFTAALACLGLVVSATPALSQPRPVVVSTDQANNCQPIRGGQSAQGVTIVATDCRLGRIPALSAFRFGFSNGDHRFRRVTLMPQGDSFEAAWEDNDGNDPYIAEGRWWRVPEAPGGVVTAVVSGVADIAIPRGPANHTLVLSGFEFRRADGSDNNIRTLAIQLDSARSAVRTVLLDDQSLDFAGLAAAAGAGFAFGAAGFADPALVATSVSGLNTFSVANAPRLTPGEPSIELIPAEMGAANATLMAPTARTSEALSRALRPSESSASADARIAERSRNVAAGREQALVSTKVSSAGARPYLVRIAYLWAPNDRLANARMVSGSGRTARESSGRLPRDAAHVLQGFSFHFGNSDHFINGVGIHLNGGGPAQNTVPNAELVTWQDSNRDDPIQWTVRFSDLLGVGAGERTSAPPVIVQPVAPPRAPMLPNRN